MMRWELLLLLSFALGAAGSAGRYVLPSLEERLRAQRRPVVDKDLAHYFQPTDTTGQVMSDLFTGFLPQPTFEVRDNRPAVDPTQAFLSSLVGSGFIPPPNNPGQRPGLPGIGVPPGLQQSLSSFQNPFDVTVRRKPGSKSTAGIPDISLEDLNLPTYPATSGFNAFPRGGPAKPAVAPQASLSNLPRIPDTPPPPPAGSFGAGVGSPFGGGGPPGSFGSGVFPSDPDSAAGIPVETGPAPEVPGTRRLMKDILGLFGANDLLDSTQPQAAAPFGAGVGAPFRDIAAFGPISSLLDSLTGAGPASALTGIIPSAIYEGIAAPSGNATNSTNATTPEFSEKSLKKNLGLIQELMTQPNSPFCSPKPQPLAQFSVDAFMGTWFQVLYSPPMSSGPCSMITYRKMEEKGQGGAGTLFSTFEYTTDGNGGSPDISSGFALLRGPGQLIYKTRSSRSDVNVHVVEAGPLNAQGQYEWVVLSVNCNYPLHVFARDPLVYNQRYAAHVNALLERRGLVDGFKRLLNIVAPVDHSLCRFPKALFGSVASPALSPSFG